MQEITTEKLALTIDKILFDKLENLARLQGVDTYAFAVEILRQYIGNNEYKLDAQLSPIDAADKADKLFAEAVRLQKVVAEQTVGTKERIDAEAEFIAILQKAAALFSEITRKLKGSEIEKHIQMRMNQIAALCDDQLTEEKKA